MAATRTTSRVCKTTASEKTCVMIRAEQPRSRSISIRSHDGSVRWTLRFYYTSELRATLEVHTCQHVNTNQYQHHHNLVPSKRDIIRKMIAPSLSLLALAPSVLASRRAPVPHSPSKPDLTYLFTVNITTAPSISMGTTPFGERGFNPITGGSFSGPRLQGKKTQATMQ